MNDWYSLPGFHQPFSSFSHLLGAFIFAVFSWLLLRLAWNDRRCFWLVAIFAAATVALLSLSGAYHMLEPGGTARAVMLRLDVAAIFVLIAASFTPLHGILFRGWKCWGMLLIVWSIAITGLTLRMIFFDSISIWLGHSVFVLMGWQGIVSAHLIWKHHGWRWLVPLVCGGVLYTLGATSNAFRWPIIVPYVWGPHETHHLTVLAGLGCHWWVVSEVVKAQLRKR